MAGRTGAGLCVLLLMALCRTHAQRFKVPDIISPAALRVIKTASPNDAMRRTTFPTFNNAKSVVTRFFTPPTSTFTSDVTRSSRRGKTIKCDRYMCNCNHREARCVGDKRRKPHYLPRLPPNIVDFRLMRSNLPTLTRHMMSNLSNFDLTWVILTSNQIRVIDQDAFADFGKLELLDLSGNPALSVRSMHDSLAGLPSRTLRTLSLAANNITVLPDDFFAVFTGSNFTKLDLQRNSLTVFNSALFAPFRVLEMLDLSRNQLNEVNITSLLDIRRLALDDNKFARFPDLCLHRSPTTGEPGLFSAFRNLLSLLVSNNQFSDLDPQGLRGACFPHLLRLDMGRSTRLTTLKINVFADLPRLQNLALSHMLDLRRIEPKAFNSSTLKKLHIYHSKLSYKLLRGNLTETFLYTTALKELHISDTVIDLTRKDLGYLLQSLTNLVRLKLHKVRIGGLPPGLLASLPNLQHLEFTGNAMPLGQLKKTLEGVTSLKTLNVQGNSINAVYEDTFSAALLENLTKIDISLNPFVCKCDLRWFRRWLDDVHKNRKVEVVNWPDRRQYGCVTGLKTTPLVDFNPTDLECMLYVILGITGGVILASLLVATLLVYRYRWHLRFCIYRIRRRRQYKKLDDQDNNIPLYRYDAYLAHSPSDVDWIMAELLPLLEGQHDLNVFLEERDEVPGSVKADNYEMNMDLSERVVLVISNNYLADRWREWEFQHVLYASIEQHKDVIVVLLNDVEPGRMTHDMRRMLMQGTFLQWGDSQQARDTFREGLTVALKTKNVNMQTSC